MNQNQETDSKSPSISNKARTHILLCNDDGIDAPGINVLYDCLSPFARISVVAPTRERSAAGHSISVMNPLLIQKKFKNNILWGYALDGTPADCMKWAITNLLKNDRPDLIISGINWGQNLGNNILYSGTVAAAMEGTMFDISSIAVSLASRRDTTPYFKTAGLFIAQFFPQVIKLGLPKGIFLNINIPNLPPDQIKGSVVSRQGKSMFVDEFEWHGDKAEFLAVRNIGNTVIHSSQTDGEDIDDNVIHAQKISITPLHYDLTHHNFRLQLQQWLSESPGSFPYQAIEQVYQDFSKELEQNPFIKESK